MLDSLSMSSTKAKGRAMRSSGAAIESANDGVQAARGEHDER